MPSLYERIAESRSDVTDWLIHWTHLRIRPVITAEESLKKIAKEGFLIPSFSIRSGKATIYGPDPAVCFTEQPLLEFAKYVELRSEPQCVSGFGVAVHKRDVHADGGLPVISGLSNAREAVSGDQEYNAERRMLTLSSLPADLQYRFVVLNPNFRDYPIDWTHEREWRWVLQSWNAGADALPGFPIGGSGRGGCAQQRGRFAFIVPTDSAARTFREFLAALTDEEAENAEFESQRSRYIVKARSAKVFSLEMVKSKCAEGDPRYARIETHP